MVKQIDNPVEHALTKQESIKLMKIINQFSRIAGSNGMSYEVIELGVVRIAGVAVLRMQTMSINKGFTTSRTGDTKFYPVLYWAITLSNDGVLIFA